MSETQNTVTPNTETQQVVTPKKKFKLAINVKVLAVILGVFFVGIAAYYAKSLFVVALVNNRPVTRLALIKELEKQGGKQTLDNLITKELIRQEILKNKIVVTSEEVDAEVKKIEDSVKTQNMTLEQVLKTQNYTMPQLREELTFNKQVEKLIADKTTVTEEEITQYMTANKDYLPKDADPAMLKAQVTEQLQQQKVSEEAQKLVAKLKQESKVVYFLNL